MVGFYKNDRAHGFIEVGNPAQVHGYGRMIIQDFDSDGQMDVRGLPAVAPFNVQAQPGDENSALRKHGSGRASFKGVRLATAPRSIDGCFRLCNFRQMHQFDLD